MERKPTRQLLSCILAMLTIASPGWLGAAAQGVNFQIIWVVVGEAASGAGNSAARAGKHLFTASELASMSLKNTQVARVQVEPAVVQIATGVRLCLSSLNIQASGSDRALIKHAPLSVSVRQDHKDRLGLGPSTNDICVTPTSPGEYQIRFTSLLPAADGTMRGAQIFVRVSEN
jgi:hypothetical protein